MKIIELKSINSGKTIFSGPYNSFAECLEDAIVKKINLEYLDLRHQNLSNANLDDAYMPCSDFTGCNLTGANLSESILCNGNFQHTTLYNCYFSYADLRDCNFMNADFGATNISGANIEKCKFSTMSCFSLDFTQSVSMTGCNFHHFNGDIYPMSYNPVVISGVFSTPVIMMDTIIKIGKNIFPKSELPVMNLVHYGLHHGKTKSLT